MLNVLAYAKGDMLKSIQDKVDKISGCLYPLENRFLKGSIKEKLSIGEAMGVKADSLIIVLSGEDACDQRRIEYPVLAQSLKECRELGGRLSIIVIINDQYVENLAEKEGNLDEVWLAKFGKDIRKVFREAGINWLIFGKSGEQMSSISELGELLQVLKTYPGGNYFSEHPGW